MDPNRLTLKTQEALHDAQTKAIRYGHTEVDTTHLLLALLEQRDGLIPRLLTRANIDTGALRTAACIAVQPAWRSGDEITVVASGAQP